MPSDDSSSKRVECPEGNGPHCFYHGPKCCHCGACDHSTCGWKPRYDDQGRPLEPEEPPLTPEEEEQAPKDEPFVQTCVRPGCVYDVRKDCRYGCKAAADELTRLDQEEMDQRWAKAMGDDIPPPPQPAGRPPFAVNYSVQGHLYQVAVPGDATVKAVDGALVIQHYLGPVAGIVQVLPIISEESNAAEADQ